MVSEKLKIIWEAEENGRNTMGHKCDVSKSGIRDWRKNQDLLL
jgi:hypothetical protein